MPQVSLYFDEKLAHTVNDRASMHNISVSKYVSTILYQHINDQWPEGYFESLGTLADIDLLRPAQPSMTSDAARERL